MKYVDPHLQMPPSGKLADEVIADFEMWIAGGAPDPRVDTAAAATAKRRVVDEAELAKGRQWWAFQAVKALPQPVSAHASTARTKLDHFVYRETGREGADAVATGRGSHAGSPRVHRSRSASSRPTSKSRHMPMTPRRTNTRSSSTRCWQCRSTASAGGVTGSTS